MQAPWTVHCVECENGQTTISALKQDSSNEVHSFAVRFVHGIPHMNSCGEQRWDYLDSNITYKSGDIIVVSFPKCGTTWTEQCVLLLLSGGNKELLNPANKNTYQPGVSTIGKLWPEPTVDQGPEVECPTGSEVSPISLEDFNNAPQPRVIKSHAQSRILLGCKQQGLAQLPEGVKVLIVSRNPLDACVFSYYHSFNPHKSGWPFDAWATVWLAGMASFGDYFQWVRGWYDDLLRNPSRGMWLQYEDMQATPREQIIKIAAYLEIPVTDTLVDAVLEHSSFDSMKQQAVAKGGDHGNHLRQGKSGDWRNHFNDELVEQFRARFRADLAGTGLKYSIGEFGDPFSAKRSD